MGCVLRQKGDLPAAIQAFEAAFSAAPSLEVIGEQLAAALTDQGTQLKAAGQVRRTGLQRLVIVDRWPAGSGGCKAAGAGSWCPHNTACPADQGVHGTV
jgi:hypothetical protein